MMKDNPACGRAERRSGRDMNFDLLNITRDTAHALGFLTRFYSARALFRGRGAAGIAGERRVSAGRLIAALPAALFLLIAPWLTVPPLLAAAIALAISIAVCGALHEDGLADTADGFFGGKDTESRSIS